MLGEALVPRVDALVQLFTRLDVQTGQEQSWCPGGRCFCEELIFVLGEAFVLRVGVLCAALHKTGCPDGRGAELVPRGQVLL